MNSTLSKIVIFAAGALVGSVATWAIVKKHYEDIANEEIESVKQRFTIEKDESIEDEFEDSLKNDNDPITEIPIQKAIEENMTIREYAAKLHEEGYTDYTDVEKIEQNKPQVISPDEFGEIEVYEQETLTYYADNVLTDDMDNVIENVDAMVGKESLTTFGQYEDDAVHVRNDEFKCYYEILLDVRKYSEVYSRNSHRAEG